MFNSPHDYLIPLLEILAKGSKDAIPINDLVYLFQKNYRQRFSVVALSRTPSGKFFWQQHLNTAIKNALKAGWINCPQPRTYRLTEPGHEWLRKHQNATHLNIDEQRPTTEGKSRQISSKYTIPIKSLSRDEYFDCLDNELVSSLGSFFDKVPFSFIQRSNYLQIKLEEFRGCHYELIIRHAKHEIALHFESSPQASESRRSAFDQHLNDISQFLGVRVYSGGFGTRGWTQIRIEKEAEPLTKELCRKFSDLTCKFISSTYPILQKVYADKRRNRRVTSVTIGSRSDNSLYTIVDREVYIIHDYLQGRSALQPDDEKLCDWVNFCYNFELFVEAIEIFSLVYPDGVHPWYYERTKKLARLCALRAKNQKLG